MATVRNIENVTATTDASGDITMDVTNGGHWAVLGVLASPDDAFNVIIRPSPDGSNQYTYKFRAFKRNSDGTIAANVSTQVRFVFAALG